MNTITITYSLIWQFKNCKHYQVSKCKRVFNTRTNREIKSSLNGGSIVFWIGKRFVTKIHPTQKPIGLYRNIFNRFAESGNNFLDTHGGSMTIARACDMELFDLDICEIDSTYFYNGVNAFDKFKQQLKLF